jgi:hypothetical protein
MGAKSSLLILGSVSLLPLSACAHKPQAPKVEVVRSEQICPAFPAQPVPNQPKEPSMVDWLLSPGNPS